jgi:hypothetical protein
MIKLSRAQRRMRRLSTPTKHPETLGFSVRCSASFARKLAAGKWFAISMPFLNFLSLQRYLL